MSLLNQIVIACAGLGLLLMLGTPVTAWTMDISLSSEGRTEVLILGSEDGASDGFDVGMDIPLPPPPPSSSFSTHLVGSGPFDRLQTDIRATYSWSIYVVSKEGITIAWNAAPVPLAMTIGEDWFSLIRSGHHSLSAGEHWITIQETLSSSISEPARDSGGGSPSSGSIVMKTPQAITPAASPAPTVTPDRTLEGMPLSSTSLTPDTPDRSTADLTSDTSQALHPAETNQTPGFGALLTLLGVGVLIVILKFGK